MRPEIPKELLLAILSFVCAVSFALNSWLKFIEPNIFTQILTFISPLSTLYFAVRYFQRSAPYKKTIRQIDWIANGRDDHRGLSVIILASEHKRGKHPDVQFHRTPGVMNPIDLDPVWHPNGDIEIFHPHNYFLPNRIECEVVIKA